MKWKEIERICVQSCSKFFGYFRSLNIPPFFFFNEIFIITSIPSQCFPLRFLIFSKHDIALTKYFRKKIFERECRTVQRIENPREGRINTDKGTIYPSVEFRNFRDRSENWKRDWKETKKEGGKEYADREAENVGDRNDRSDATGSTPPWITLSANWQQTNETVSKSRCARIPLPSPNSRSLCTRLNSLTIYILYIYISSIHIYTRRWLSSILIVISRPEFLIVCSFIRENISRAVVRFFQFPPIANRDFELLFESMKWMTLLLSFLKLLFFDLNASKSISWIPFY